MPAKVKVDAAVDQLCDDAFKNKVALVKAMLQAVPVLKDRVSKARENSVLYTACRFGHLELVKYLVEEAGCDVNLPNGPKGVSSTPLHGAAFGGHVAVVQFLVENGATLQQNDYGDTPLEDLENSEAVSEADKAKCKAVLMALKDGKVVLKAKTKDRKEDHHLAGGEAAAPPPASPPASPAKAKADAPASPAKAKADAPASPAKAKADAPASPAKADAPADAAPPPSVPLSKMTVAQLKARCKELGVSDSGTKAVLIRNIETAGQPPEGAPSPKKPKAAPAPTPASASADDLLNPLSAASIAELKTATFTLSDVPKDGEAFWDMEDKFKANIQGRIEDYVQARLKAGKKPLTFILWKCEKVTNEVLARRFERRKAALLKESPENARERVSFHGTNPKHVESICKTSLLRFKHPLNPCKTQSDDGYFGTNRKGVYVSRYSDYTYKYCNDLDALDAGQTARIVMFRTLPGKSFHITKLVGGIDPTPGYHSHSSPNYMEWYLFSEDQLCPEYVLTVKAMEDSRTVADDEECA